MEKVRFLSELEIFRKEAATAQQYFFAYLSVRSLAAENSDVLNAINQNALFWLTAHHAMLAATFSAVGRIFEQKQKSKHNIGTLMSAVSTAIEAGAFSPASLEARYVSQGLTAKEAADVVERAHNFTDRDVRTLQADVDHWRSVYRKRYKEIRDKVFAHGDLVELEDINALMAKTKVDEMKDLFKFLSSLHLGLWAAYHHGVAINFNSYDEKWFVGERIYQEAQAVLKSMLSGSKI
jgi:hypothetical protein